MAFNTEYAETLHRHVVMWVDQHIGVPGSNEIMKNRFRRVTYPLETFIDVQPAIDFIHQQQATGKSIFLIISGSLAREVVPQIYDLDCVTQIFIFCGNIANHYVWAEQYIDKVLIFESDEELLIRFTNEIANYLKEEANKYDKENKAEQAAGLLDWAAWLYNDADTLQRAVCQKVLNEIRQRRQKLDIDHRIVHPNRIDRG